MRPKAKILMALWMGFGAAAVYDRSAGAALFLFGVSAGLVIDLAMLALAQEDKTR